MTGRTVDRCLAGIIEAARSGAPDDDLAGRVAELHPLVHEAVDLHLSEGRPLPSGLGLLGRELGTTPLGLCLLSPEQFADGVLTALSNRVERMEG